MTLYLFSLLSYTFFLVFHFMSIPKQFILSPTSKINPNDIYSPFSSDESLLTYLVRFNSELDTLKYRLNDTVAREIQFLQNSKATISDVQTLRLESTATFQAKANVTNPSFVGTIQGVTKDSVALSLVDNTADLNKPISYLTQQALNTKVNTSTYETGLNDLYDDLSEDLLALQSSLQLALSEFNTGFQSSLSLKQNVLSNSNRLPVSSIDLSNSSLTYVDIQSSLVGLLADVQSQINQTYNTLMTSKHPLINSFAPLSGNVVTFQDGSSLNYQILSLYQSISNLSVTVSDALSLKVNTSSLSSILTPYATISSTDSALSLKEDLFSSSHLLNASYVETNVSEVQGTLNTVLQGIIGTNTLQSNSLADTISDLINVEGVVDGHTTSISNLNSGLTSTNGNVSILGQGLTTLQGQVAGKQATITISSPLDSTKVYVEEDELYLSAKLQELDASINTLTNQKHPLIQTTSKLPYTLVDFTGSRFSNLDYDSSIASKFTSLDSTIQTLTGLQAGDVTSFQQINADIDTLESAIATLTSSKQSIITSSNKISGDLVQFNSSFTVNQKINELILNDQQAIPSITYDTPTNTTLISGVLSLDTSLRFADTSVQSTAFTSAKNADLTSVKSKTINLSSENSNTTITGACRIDGLLSTQLDSLSSTLESKQPTITTSSRLDCTLVGTGEVSNTKLNYLKNLQGDLATSLTGIASSILTLQGNDTAQGILNGQYTGDISTLYSTKQNLLSSSNLLNSAYLACSGDGIMSNTKMQYLSSISADIQSQLASKQSTIQNGSLTIANTSGLQSALDSKQDTLSNASFLDATSSIQTQLAGKQNYLTNAVYLDVTSSIQDQLNAKQSTIQDGSLTIARTSGLQSALNGKQDTLTNAIYLDATSSVQTQLNGKQATLSNASFLDATSSVQTQLNEKQNTLSNAAFLDATSSVQTQLNGKQTILSNASFLDATSSVQTQLNAKSNLSGSTYSGTHDFSNATVTGISFADGSLTIAKTNGLQTALNSKSNLNGSTYTGTHDFTGATVTGVTASSSVGLYSFRIISGTVTSSPLTLQSTDVNKVVRFSAGANLSVNLPSTTGVTDGSWIAVSCNSITSARTITICDSSGNAILGGYNANVTSGGNCKQLIVLGGAWVALSF